ncbi:FAD-binding oxidoreductase [Leptolyngbya sp. FACHB-36]|uniref:NAD(P)/FAD-dependent oxidoreductase n=1 Tax=Leptolyngbya sp. FACHB-36 TaxID=2692808 RepID=UPI00168154E7|nr:FAD-binding oxidoreductase [Leptolyngbya sp. FACHB-36]MBD2022807.1 FAD-binding oxidoreductase [Leptolyngbya sp. FACHB-36]
MTLTEEIFSQLPEARFGLQQADALWRSLREGTLPTPTVVQVDQSEIEPAWDVVICGGTLGILIGAALAQRGWRVALIERGRLRGREQEWNVSRKELQTFVELGLLTPTELEHAIATQYNPARIQFFEGPAFWVRDVLNIGVDPVYLLEVLKQRFLTWGGHLFEQTPFETAIVHSTGVCVKAGGQEFLTRLMLDAMGHFSPIVQQARQGKKPDAVCLVVGTCAEGFANNDSGDLLVSFTPLQHQCQYFWEAFPARDGRTTYLFTYLDADRDRLSLEALFEDYLRLLPSYQNTALDQLRFKRALFGLFPCYRQSPLKPSWNRILPVGDSSGGQSPLSFGGFGAMVRHLKRLSDGIHDALQSEALDRASLTLLQPYQPNLAVTWLFQRAMSVGMNQTIAPNQINQLLSAVFTEMSQLGDPVLKPFLQDVVQWSPLSQTLVKTSLAHPDLVLKILPQVGVPTLLNWLLHYTNLAGYTALALLAQRVSSGTESVPSKPQYAIRRWLEALEYGSGGDYSD